MSALLEHPMIDVNLQNSAGYSALHCAGIIDAVECCKLLIVKGHINVSLVTKIKSSDLRQLESSHSTRRISLKRPATLLNRSSNHQSLLSGMTAEELAEHHGSQNAAMAISFLSKAFEPAPLVKRPSNATSDRNAVVLNLHMLGDNTLEKSTLAQAVIQGLRKPSSKKLLNRKSSSSVLVQETFGSLLDRVGIQEYVAVVKQRGLNAQRKKIAYHMYDYRELQVSETMSVGSKSQYPNLLFPPTSSLDAVLSPTFKTSHSLYMVVIPVDENALASDDHSSMKRQLLQWLKLLTTLKLMSIQKSNSSPTGIWSTTNSSSNPFSHSIKSFDDDNEPIREQVHVAVVLQAYQPPASISKAYFGVIINALRALQECVGDWFLEDEVVVKPKRGTRDGNPLQQKQLVPFDLDISYLPIFAQRFPVESLPSVSSTATESDLVSRMWNEIQINQMKKLVQVWKQACLKPTFNDGSNHSGGRLLVNKSSSLDYSEGSHDHGEDDEEDDTVDEEEGPEASSTGDSSSVASSVLQWTGTKLMNCILTKFFKRFDANIDLMKKTTPQIEQHSLILIDSEWKDWLIKEILEFLMPSGSTSSPSTSKPLSSAQKLVATQIVQTELLPTLYSYCQDELFKNDDCRLLPLSCSTEQDIILADKITLRREIMNELRRFFTSSSAARLLTNGWVIMDEELVKRALFSNLVLDNSKAPKGSSGKLPPSSTDNKGKRISLSFTSASSSNSGPSSSTTTATSSESLFLSIIKTGRTTSEVRHLISTICWLDLICALGIAVEHKTHHASEQHHRTCWFTLSMRDLPLIPQAALYMLDQHRVNVVAESGGNQLASGEQSPSRSPMTVPNTRLLPLNTSYVVRHEVSRYFQISPKQFGQLSHAKNTEKNKLTILPGYLLQQVFGHLIGVCEFDIANTGGDSNKYVKAYRNAMCLHKTVPYHHDDKVIDMSVSIALVQIDDIGVVVSINSYASLPAPETAAAIKDQVLKESKVVVAVMQQSLVLLGIVRRRLMPIKPLPNPNEQQQDGLTMLHITFDEFCIASRLTPLLTAWQVCDFPSSADLTALMMNKFCVSIGKVERRLFGCEQDVLESPTMSQQRAQDNATEYYFGYLEVNGHDAQSVVLSVSKEIPISVTSTDDYHSTTTAMKSFSSSIDSFDNESFFTSMGLQRCNDMMDVVDSVAKAITTPPYMYRTGTGSSIMKDLAYQACKAYMSNSLNSGSLSGSVGSPLQGLKAKSDDELRISLTQFHAIVDRYCEPQRIVEDDVGGSGSKRETNRSRKPSEPSVKRSASITQSIPSPPAPNGSSSPPKRKTMPKMEALPKPLPAYYVEEEPPATSEVKVKDDDQDSLRQEGSDTGLFLDFEPSSVPSSITVDSRSTMDSTAMPTNHPPNGVNTLRTVHEEDDDEDNDDEDGEETEEDDDSVDEDVKKGLLNRLSCSDNIFGTQDGKVEGICIIA